MADTAARPVTDARFLEVLQTVADQVVDATGEGRNGESFQAYRDVVDVFETPAAIPYTVWLREQVEGTLSRPASDRVRAMLEARARLGENIRLIADIDIVRARQNVRRLVRDRGRVGAGLRPTDELDEFETLLDFVAEVREIAKDI